MRLADTQVTAGKIQVGTGAVNTALGVVQLVQSSGAQQRCLGRFRKEQKTYK